MSVKEIQGWDELKVCLRRLQESLHMLEEPWFVPPAK
jgi:hypothetical protein